jgi:hypothetical protein
MSLQTAVVPVAQAPVPPVKRFASASSEERVAPYPLPPLRLYPPVRLSRAHYATPAPTLPVAIGASGEYFRPTNTR